jgi:hypothetical protein
LFLVCPLKLGWNYSKKKKKKKKREKRKNLNEIKHLARVRLLAAGENIPDDMAPNVETTRSTCKAPRRARRSAAACQWRRNGR